MSSGFSFLFANSTTVEKVPVPGAATQEITAAHIALGIEAKFVERHSPSVDVHEFSLLGPPILSDQTVKLFKSSEAKPVKKKKRAPKVGFARGDENTEDDADGGLCSSTHDSSLSDSVSQPDSEPMSSTTEEVLSSRARQPTLSNVSAARATYENDAVVAEYDQNDHTIMNSAASSGLQIDNDVNKHPSIQSDLILQQARRVPLHELRTRNDVVSESGLAVRPAPTSDSAQNCDVFGSGNEPSVTMPSSMVPSTTASSHQQPASPLMFDGMSIAYPKGEVTSAYEKISTHSSDKVTSLTQAAVLEAVSAKAVVSVSAVSAFSAMKDEADLSSQPPNDPYPVFLQPSVTHTADTEAASAWNGDHIKEEEGVKGDAAVAGPLSSSSEGESKDASNVHVAVEQSPSEDLGPCHTGPSIAERQTQELYSAFSDSVTVLVTSQLADARRGSEQRKELTRVRAELVETKHRSAVMEADQLRLAALEEFDQADSLTECLETLQSDAQALTQRARYLQTVTARCPLSDSETDPGSAPPDALLSATQTEQVAVISKLIDGLTFTTVEESDRVDRLREVETEALDLDEARLKGEAERIGVEETYTAEEESTLLEQEGEMELVIAAQAGSAIERRAELEARAAIVSEEILDLERLLAAKRAEKGTLLQELESVNERISTVRHSFQRQIQRIDDRRALLAATRTSWEQDRIELCEGRRRHEQRTQRSEKLWRCYAKWSRGVKGDVEVLRATLRVLYPTHSSERGPSESDPSSSSTSSSSSPSSPEVLFRDARARLGLLEDTLAHTLVEQMRVTALGESLESEAKEVQDLCIKLEAEKKANAVARRFKEAAIVAKDEKGALQRREDLRCMIARNLDLLQEKAQEVCALQEEREGVSAEVCVAEANADAARYTALTSHRSDVEATRQSLLRQSQSCGGDVESKGDRSSEEQTEESKEKKQGEGEDREDQPNAASASPIVLLCLFLLSSKLEVLSIEIWDLEDAHPCLHVHTGVEDPSLQTIAPSTASNPTAQQEQEERQGEDREEDRGEGVGTEAGVAEEGAPQSPLSDPAVSPGSDDALFPCSNPVDPTQESEEAEAKRALDIAQAKDMVCEIGKLEEELLLATDDEDYELADKVDGRILDLRGGLAQLLRVLGISEAELSVL